MRLLFSDLGVEDPDILCAADLHDVWEDTNYPHVELRQIFGGPTVELAEEPTVPAGLLGHSVPDPRKAPHMVAVVR